MAMMDTIEGVTPAGVWFHYDLPDDVLYLCIASSRTRPAVGEETPEGLILMRDEETDEAIGLTVISWWARFGRGTLPDSIREIEARIETIARRVKTAA